MSRNQYGLIMSIITTEIGTTVLEKGIWFYLSVRGNPYFPLTYSTSFCEKLVVDLVVRRRFK